MGRLLATALAAGLLVAAGPADAQTPDDIRATLAELKADAARQAERINKLEQQLRDEQLSRQREDDVRRILKEIREDMAPRCPQWLENLTFFGDLYLRWETIRTNRGQMEENVGKFWLRFGFKYTCMDEQMEVGFRLASGGDRRPTSTLQNLTDQFDEKQIWIDWAYARYSPNWLKGVSLTLGKFKNPLRYTDIIWDTDVSPEGAWLAYDAPEESAPFTPFAGVGVWAIQHNPDAPDAELHVYQAGWHWQVAKGLRWTPSVAWYDYAHIEDNFDIIGPVGNSEANNRLLAEEFNMVDMLNRIEWDLFGVPVQAYFDFVRNTANRFDDQSNAYGGWLLVGRLERKGDWQVLYKYARIEANAIVGGFSDANFGGSNRKGHRLTISYQVSSCAVIGVSGYFTEVITGPFAGDTQARIQGDLYLKF